MIKLISTILSWLFLFLSVFPFFSTSLGIDFLLLYNVFDELTIFMPILFSILGIFFGVLSKKQFRFFLISINTLIMLLHLLIIFAGIFGFNDP